MSITQVNVKSIFFRKFDSVRLEMVFVIGLSFLGILSLGAGFVNNKIAIIVLRALMGIRKRAVAAQGVKYTDIRHSICDDNTFRSRTLGACSSGTTRTSSGDCYARRLWCSCRWYVSVLALCNFANEDITFEVLGLFIGSVLVQYGSFHWVFWFAAIVAIPVALACLFIIPPQVEQSEGEQDMSSAKWERLDPIGILILTGISSP